MPISRDTGHSPICVSRLQKSAQPVNLLWLQELGSVSAGVSLPHPTSTQPLSSVAPHSRLHPRDASNQFIIQLSTAQA